MKKRLRSTIAATLLTTALLALAALPAMAEPDFSGYIQDQNNGDHFTLTVQAYPSGESDGSAFVGLTTGILTEYDASNNATGVVSAAFAMFCSDFLHDITVGAIYNVNIESLVTPAGEDATTYIPDPSPGLNLNLQTLQTQSQLGADFNGNLDNDINVQHDVWNLSGATPPLSGPDPSAMATLEATAEAKQPGGTYTDAYLLDPSGSGGQAFMNVPVGGFNNNTGSPTPEPGTIAMLGLGLIGLGSFKLRKRKR